MGAAVSQEKATSSTRYTILGRLASGGMADIFLALVSSEAGIDRHLVLKRVLAERARDPVFCQMFLDEARLAAQLQHPNIAQVYDVGKLDGAYFFSMEYVHGEDVRGVLQALSKLKKQIPENLALFIAAGALSALHYAHERATPDGTPLGVVHRDVTPSNIMISLDGSIKLLDFGVAKAAQRSTETQSGSIKGKVAYLSPEQCQTSKIDRRTDIYALGIVLWELLTGTRLYRRETDFATMLAITNEPVPKPSTKRPNLSPEVERIVMTALEKDRDKRYPTAAAMLEDLEAVATAERLGLSQTAMGRFMKELFGAKKEPWKELKAQQTAESSPVTVTAESLKIAAEPTHTGEIKADVPTRILDQAPDLRPIGKTSEDPITPVPNTPVWGEKTPAPDDEESKFMSVEPSAETDKPAKPAPPVTVAAEPVAPRKKWIPLAALAVAGVAAAGIGLAMRGGDKPAAQKPAPDKVAVVDPAAIPDAAAVAVPAASADASVAAVTAPIATDWASLQARCESEPAADVVACGAAACTAGVRAKALVFYRRADKAGQKSIDAACKAKGIALVQKATGSGGATNTGGNTTTTKTPPKDPCKDPAYVEANPLKCQ